MLVAAVLLVVFVWRPWNNGGSNEESIKTDEEHFPDEGFREYVRESFDRDDDGWLNVAERGVVSEIIAYATKEWKINSLKGIEYFAFLENLYCADNHLTELDVGQNPEPPRSAGGSVFFLK